MRSRFIISTSTRNIITAMLVMFLFALTAYCLITTRSWIGRPFAGFLVMKNNLVPIVGAPGWKGFESGIKFGDIITAMDGEPLESGDELNGRVAEKEPGVTVTYTVKRRGQELHIPVEVSVFKLRDYLIVFPLIMFAGAFLYLTGVVVFFLKHNNVESRVFLFCAILIGLTLVAVTEYSTNHKNFIPAITLCLIGPSVTLLGLYFPAPHRLRKHIIAGTYVVALPLTVLYVSFYHFADILHFTIIDTIMQVQISINNILGLFFMARSFYASEDPLTRQKAKMMVYGTTLTCMLCMVFVIGNLILKIMILFWFLPLSISVLPLAVGYAIVKHNLFDVDVFIRRTVGYVILTVIVVALFFGTAGVFGILLQRILGDPSQVSAVLATLVMVGVARPIHNRIRDGINRRFYRERYEYSNTIRKASKVLAGIIDKERLLNELLDTIMDAVKIERGVLLLRNQHTNIYETAVARDYSEGFQNPAAHETLVAKDFSLRADHPLFRRLEEMGRSLQLNDIDRPDVFGDDRESMLRAAEAMRVVLVIPILYEDRLVGVLGLGPKRTGAWYSTEDVDLLQTLMDQAAISIENARSVEEMKRIVEIETSYRELKKIDEMKDNFLSMVSHDLRTPMTGIMAYASIMRESLETIKREDEQKYLDVIIQQGQRLTRLINDLLDIQRFEAGRMSLEFQDINIVTLVGDTLSLFEGAAGEKNQELVLERPPAEEILVSGSRDRLEQVMTNLLSNAIKFTPPGGRISVEIQIMTRDDTSAVKVMVRDTGPGIPAEAQGRIFDKFQQVDSMVRSKEQGSGLGLALVRWIVESHDGKVGLESEPGFGSVFFFVLPLKE